MHALSADPERRRLLRPVQLVRRQRGRMSAAPAGPAVGSRRPASHEKIAACEHTGIPVSTTHTITGSIVGVGAARRLSAVRWGVAGRVVWARVLTIPGAFTVSFLAFLVVDLVS